MQCVEIVQAEPADAERILALQRLAYQSEAALYQDRSIPPLTQTLDDLLSEFAHTTFLKATRAGVLVGSVRGRLREGTCAIGRLIVHPDHQRQGIGTRLMFAIEEAFLTAERFEVFTGERSEGNLRLYERLGYRPFRREQLSPQVTLVFLEKRQDDTPQVLEALRLPELYRAVCLHASLPLPLTPPRCAERFVLRCGAEPPGLFAKLLEEALVDDEAEVLVWPADDPPDYHALPPGHVAIRPGFDHPCPEAERLRQAVSPEGGRVLIFAVERRDLEGRLLGVTWAAVPEEEPPPEAGFRAAVLRRGPHGPRPGGGP